MHAFPRPTDAHLSVERRAVPGTCSACGAEALAEYPVLSEGGWWDVRKCQACLTSVSRVPGQRYGSFTPLGLEI